MRFRVQSFGVHQTSKVFSLIYAFLTAIFCIPAGVFYLFSNPQHALALFLTPLLVLVFYYIATAVALWFYNLVSKGFGGMEVDCVEIPKE